MDAITQTVTPEPPPDTDDPWWLLRVAVPAGECTPFEYWLMYHAERLPPMQGAEQ